MICLNNAGKPSLTLLLTDWKRWKEKHRSTRCSGKWDWEEKWPWAFGAAPLVPSAFSPAFSSCSLTTSFMCCHWGSPSPISWTLTSPLGLLPVLYLVILILTWSSAAWSGLTRQKRDKHHSWPCSQSAGPQDGSTTSLNQKLSHSNIWVFGPFQWFWWLCSYDLICKIISWLCCFFISVWAHVV